MAQSTHIRQPALPVHALIEALAIRDLSDPAQGPHALQLLLAELGAALHCAWPDSDQRIVRRSPLTSIANNYDRLHYPAEGAARDARHTRYVGDDVLLRTQTSAMIPPALAELAREVPQPSDVTLLCPGLVYRRDSIDRLHTGEPHQLDVWRLSRKRLTQADLSELVHGIVTTLLPGREHRSIPAEHPYTEHGLQADVRVGDEWVEVLECGLALPALLLESGLAGYTGLALGLGLDRCLMLRKGIADIRLLRSREPRVASQMLDLSPYRPVSAMPAVRRDLSLVLDPGADAEHLGALVREALGVKSELVESVELLTLTPYRELHENARRRLGLSSEQSNGLVRITLRAADRSLTHAECHELRNAIYLALHQGPHLELIE
ncbi:MAG: hypothetical protein R3B07_17980 [Polyangiaceae bacterium]